MSNSWCAIQRARTFGSCCARGRALSGFAAAPLHGIWVGLFGVKCVIAGGKVRTEPRKIHHYARFAEISRELARFAEIWRDADLGKSRMDLAPISPNLANSRLEAGTIARIAGDAPLDRIFHIGTRKRMVRQPVLGCTAYGV